MQPEEELSEAEQKTMMEEQGEQMKAIIQGAIIDMINKPENQEALQKYIGQFMQGVSGASAGGEVFGMGWDKLTNQDGELDLVKAAFAFFNQRGKGAEKVALSGTRGAY